VALALLIGWLGPALPLAEGESEVCAMECCVAEGHCCCCARKPYRILGIDISLREA
jgi:hypothetical protein